MFFKFQNRTLVKYFFVLFGLCSVLILFSACNFDEPQDKYYSLTYSASDGGKIEGKTEQLVKEGENAEEVTAVPDEGYCFVKWSDGLTTATRQDTNVTSAITATAEFEKITYTVKYIAGEGGTISGNANQQVKYSENAEEVTAMPNEGYYFVKWSDGVTTATRQDTNVASAITLTAEFEKITYNVQYLVGEGGTISGKANQQVKYGESAEAVTAVPNEGYYFVKWSDGVTTATRLETNVTSAITETAEFEKITYTVQYLAGEGGTISGNANQQIKHGENAEEVTAVPNEGYKFVKWSDGIPTATRQDTNVTSAITVTAEFRLIEFAGGIGTPLDPYLIENYEQFKDIYKYPAANYKLISDLDLSGIKHEPKFDDANSFTGVFDGGGYTINNLTVETENNYPSLFGFIGVGGIVKNLIIENADITAINFNTLQQNAEYCIGILAGVSYGMHQNVNVSGVIHGDTFHYDQITIGGLIGMAYSDIESCNSDVDITVSGIERLNNTGSLAPYVFGGLIGRYYGAKLNNCLAKGSLTVSFFQSSSGQALIGGLVGRYYALSQTLIISNCQTNVEISGGRAQAGGFISDLDLSANIETQIYNCSAHGAVTSTNASGFIYEGSFSSSKLQIEQCFADNDITCSSIGVGFIHRLSGIGNKCNITNCYSSGTIKTHLLDEPENLTGQAWGFGYQLSGINITNCYSSGNISGRFGGGFIWSINNCVVQNSYSDCIISLAASAGSGIFAYYILNSSIENCYSRSDIFDFTTQTDFTLEIIKFLRSSKLNRFYYAGNSNGNIVGIIYNSEITNVHVLENARQESDLIGEDRGEISSTVDITLYKTREEMYLLSDKLNKGLAEEVWVDCDNDFPQLKFMV